MVPKFLIVLFVMAMLPLAGCMQTTLPIDGCELTRATGSCLRTRPTRRRTCLTYLRHIVDYPRKEQPGTILVDTAARYLYFVLPEGKAIRYGVAVARKPWPSPASRALAVWRNGPLVSTAEIQARLGPYPARVAGGPANPLGARGIYLYLGNKDTLYRIHGTNQPEYIGQAISSGCIRMRNEDVIDLFDR